MAAVESALLQWFPRVAGWLWRSAGRARPDHRAILGTWGNADGLDGYYVRIAVAPDRSVRRQDLDAFAGHAEELIDVVFPGGFAPSASQNEGRAAHSSDLEVRFEGPDVAGRSQLTVRVLPSGLLDILWPLDVITDMAGRESLRLDQVVDLARRVADATTTPEYTQLIPGSFGRPRSRLDWYIAITTYRQSPQGPRSWDNLAVPAPLLARARGGRPIATLGGLTGSEGRGRRRTANPEPLIHGAIRKFVRNAGYLTPEQIANALVA